MMDHCGSGAAEARSAVESHINKSSQATRQWLLDLVWLIDSRIDPRMVDNVHSASGEDGVQFLEVVLARITAATSDLFADADERVRERVAATGAAARAFVAEPSEQRSEELFEAASNSFPFGPGEGCLAVDELGGHGTPGAGCVSGAGFIWDVAEMIGAERTREAIVAELGPWLAGRDDALD